MLTAKEWLKTKKNSEQFVPTKCTINFVTTVTRILDGKSFGLLMFNKADETEYFFDKSSGETAKMELGICRFYDDNIHVDIMCHSSILNELTITHTDIVTEVQINDIERYYPQLITTNKDKILKKLSENKKKI